jgi:hypothetical protein
MEDSTIESMQHSDTEEIVDAPDAAVGKTSISAKEKIVEGTIHTTDAPLIDIHSSSKGKMIEGSSTAPVTPIAELKLGSYDNVIEVRVYRKWISVSYRKKDEGGFSGKKIENAFCCILIDIQVCAKSSTKLKFLKYINSINK